MTIIKSFSGRGIISLLAVLGLVAGLLSFAILTQAHSDPSECSATGAGLSLSVFRADGFTPVNTSGDGTVQSGETIKYQATLNHGGPPTCNFEGGTLSITTPDDVTTVVASGTEIPLVSFGNSFVGPQVTYVVSEADVEGDITNGDNIPARAEYVDGISHFGSGHQTVSAASNISTPYTGNSLEVEKTADPAFDREFLWDIEKTVDIAEHNLESGQTGDSEYTVEVTQTGSEDSNYSVSGTITIHNPAEFADAVITDVSDSLSIDGAASVDCGVTFPFNLGPGADLECTYSADLTDNSTQTNTVTVTTSGDVNGGEGEAEVNFDGVEPTNVINEEVNVDDTFEGNLGMFSESDSVSYIRTFMCNDDLGLHDNTATILETGQSDDASVQVNCTEVSLEVEKTADPAFDQVTIWEIEKSVDIDEHNLLNGQSADSTYTIAIDKTTMEDNYSVSGTISIHNPAQFANAVIGSVDDTVNGTTANVDCGVTFPHTLVAGDTLDCTYTVDGLAGDEELNTVTVEVTQDSDVSGNSASAPIDWNEATVTETGFDEVTITDTNSEFAAQNGGDPVTTNDDVIYTYDVTFMCDADGGRNPNTATIVETGQSDDASVTVSCLSASIDIEKHTNGEDADSPTGPVIPVGDPVNWEYFVTNTGDVTLTNVVVTDDQGETVSCPGDTLASGETMTCTASGTAEAGQYANIGTAVGTTPIGTDVQDNDPSHYFGEEEDFQGCTPGYWKQSHHFDSWVSYVPEDSFSLPFERTISVMWSAQGRPGSVLDPTLLQSLEANGGGINALARHAVAALLNSTNGDVDYSYTTAEVITMVQDAIDDENYNATKDLLEEANELGCPL